jgi:hypothetical protein
VTFHTNQSSSQLLQQVPLLLVPLLPLLPLHRSWLVLHAPCWAQYLVPSLHQVFHLKHISSKLLLTDK